MQSISISNSDELEHALAAAVDSHFYTFTYGSLPPGVDAASHYVASGWRLGWDPNPWFSTEAYLVANPELANSETVPLFHFLERGEVDGSAPFPSKHAAAYYSRPPKVGELLKPDVDYAAPPSVRRAPDPATPSVANHVIPPALFDASYYERIAMQEDLPPFRPGESHIAHWLREGLSRRLVPTPRFDEEFYAQTYSDIASTDTFGFLHFVEYGLGEGRLPNCWFSPSWYLEATPELANDAPAYIHFLTTGIQKGRMPSASLADFLDARGDELTLATYDELNEWSQKRLPGLDERSVRLFLALFLPEWHDVSGAADASRAIVHYLQGGLAQGIPPGPLFDTALYWTLAAEASLPAPKIGEPAILHWLRYGAPSHVVPTGRFDEAFYRKTYSDIGRSGLWGFEHFVLYGAREGRRPTAKIERLRRPSISRRNGINILPRCYRQWIKEDTGKHYHPGTISHEDDAAAETESRLSELLQSDAFREIVLRARALEPSLPDVDEITEIWLPPVSDELSIVHDDVRKRLTQDHYDTIICMPWMRMGGADLVGGILANSLLRIRPDERILILRTDTPHLERTDWYPAGADIVDISDIHESLPAFAAERLLYAVLVGLTPRRIINLNSLLCWRVLQRFGSRLSFSASLYSCVFCWDILPSGVRVGFATAEFFAETFSFTTTFITDTFSFKRELSETYAIPEKLQPKIVPLMMPARLPLRTPSVARLAAQATTNPKAKIVAWAGRLDRQKRFDLVQKIAALMPETQFHCWGKPLVDPFADISESPPNITMHAPFSSYDEIPLSTVGAWLFTSGWEGMPNTIVEAATLGFPIVATAVGGIGELIQPETGWPIDLTAGAEVYVQALQFVLRHPDEAIKRAERLQALVFETHSTARLDLDVAAVLDREPTR